MDSSYLRREVAAELELLERNGHGVGAKEEDEGHEGQVGDILTGGPHQGAAIFLTVFLTQLTPVQVRQVKLQEETRVEHERELERHLVAIKPFKSQP